MKNKLLLAFIKEIKRIVDSIYYKLYTTSGRENLIRNTFPGIRNLEDTSFFEYFITNATPEQLDSIIKIITIYYWGQMASILARGESSEVDKLHGLLLLAEEISTCKHYILTDK